MFDDVLVLGEDALGEPGHERPYRVDQAGHRRLLDRQVAERAVGALLGIERGVVEPHLEHRIPGRVDVAPHPHAQALRRIVGANAHVIREVLLGLAALSDQVDDHLLADRRPALGPAERVFDLRPVVAVRPADAARLDRAHVLPMHELMVHVEQVLVHERVVAGHLAVEAARLVVAALRQAERRGHPRRRE